MASFPAPCPKSSSIIEAVLPNSKQYQHHPCHHRSISFQSASISSSTLLAQSYHDQSRFPSFQGTSQSQSDAFKLNAQLNDVAVEKFSSSPVELDESEEKPAREYNIPDASSISAFMTQVADLIELVDSRDITELQLKQTDCELIIRKKEALPPPAPVYLVQQPPSSQYMMPTQMAPPPPSSVSTPSPQASAQMTPPVSAQPKKSSLPPLKCPMAGTLYRSPAPGAPPFIKVGDKVQKGQVVCIIEAMKLMNEIEADQSGTIVEILVDDGKPVSLDMPLLVIEP